MHALRIQRQTLPSHVASIQRRSRGAIEDGVAIAARQRAKARMEIVIDLYRPAYAHTGRQTAGGAQHPGTFAARCDGIEMDHLTAGVHASIGATGAGHLDRMISDQRYAQNPLREAAFQTAQSR